MKAQKRLSPLLCLLLAAVMVLPGHPSLAGDDWACKDTAKPPGFEGMTLEQRDDFCHAAQAARDAAQRQKWVAVGYGLTAAACTLGCIGKWTGNFAALQVCRSLAVASTVGAIVASETLKKKWKEFTAVPASGAVTQIMSGNNPLDNKLVGKGMGFLKGGGSPQQIEALPYDAFSKDEALKDLYTDTDGNVSYSKYQRNIEQRNEQLKAEKKKSDNRNDSCAGAVFATLMAGVETHASVKSAESARENYKNASFLISSYKPPASTSNGGGLNQPPGTPGNVTPVVVNPTNPSDDGGNGEKQKECDPGYNGSVQCALAGGASGLPPEIASPEFKQALEKVSGVNADRLAKLQDPGNIMRAALGNALGADGKQKLEELLAANQQAVLAAEMPSSTYASAGGGSKASGDGMPDFNGLIDKLMPKEGEGQPGVGRPKSLNLGQAQRGIASKLGDEENPRMSLFTRVSNRYQVSSGRVSGLEYQLRQNRD